MWLAVAAILFLMFLALAVLWLHLPTRRVALAVCVAIAVLAAWGVGRAQSLLSNAPFQFQTPGVHTSCTVVPSQTEFCFAGDGLWQSLNGGAYVQITTQSVTSVNGKTGAVTLTIQ